MLVKYTTLLASVASLVAASSEPLVDVQERQGGRPNIIFILTDDQDQRMDSLQYMKGVQANLISKGASYTHHYCTVALCCPSRVNLWTGRAAHNTNVTDLNPPYGGYEKFTENGFNDDWLPLWMQQAGYSTYYVGKLMNSYSDSNYLNPPVRGFNGSDFLIGGGTYNYYNPRYQRNIGNNHMAPKTYQMNYTTDLTFSKGMAFLDDARKSNAPFFLTMATVAPHNGNGPRPNSDSDFGPVPKAKYAQDFKGIQVPRTANFNPDQKSGASWVRGIDQLGPKDINRNDEYYRQRIRALQSVDELVNGTFDYLKQYNLLDNTYVIYSTDNGFHISQHRLYPGKNCPYEEDINIPLIIRGPGVTAGSTVNVATSHTDLAPTILRMAGADNRNYLDGSAVPMIAANPMTQNFEHAQIEHWGDAGSDDDKHYSESPGFVNTTYKALRIIGNNYNFYYAVWCDGSHELYDMNKDGQQMNNIFTPYTYKPNEPTTDPFSINRLESRLDALLLVLKDCKQQTCIKPWVALHPNGDVTSLPDAMDAKYDQFYEKQQNRVSFDKCTKGYIKAQEGPQTFLQYNAMQNRFAFKLA